MFLIRCDERVYFTNQVKEDEHVLDRPTIQDFVDWCKTNNRKAYDGGTVREFVALVNAIIPPTPAPDLNYVVILKNAREVYYKHDEDHYLEIIRKTADALEQAIKEINVLKRR